MSIVAWLKRLTRRRLDDDDFQEEIRAHLAIAADERIADGADPRDARSCASLKEFGNVTLTTEAARRVWTPWWLDALHDQVERRPLRDPRAREEPGVLAHRRRRAHARHRPERRRLHDAQEHRAQPARRRRRVGPARASSSAKRARDASCAVSYPDYQYLRDHDRAFSGLFGSSRGHGQPGPRPERPPDLRRARHRQLLSGARRSRRSSAARSCRRTRSRRAAIRSSCISDGLWRRDFGADPDIVGKTIEINNFPLTVVGVADPTFHGTIVELRRRSVRPGDDGAAARLHVRQRSRRRRRASSPTGARRSSIRRATCGRARRSRAPPRRPTRSGPRSRAIGRSTDAAQRLRVVPFWQIAERRARRYMLPTLIVLSAMGLLVLLIACANIAGLVLVRGVSRRGEIAVRLALGATRTRIVRLLIVENLVLAVPGAVLGVLLARRGIPVLVGYAERLAAPQRIFFNIEVDRLVIGFAALVACGSALVFGFVPALQSSRVDLVSVINEDASPRGAARGRLRAGLVVAQVAVSLLLLVGAGLATRSLEAARRADPGFDASHVTAIALDVKQNGYDEPRGRVFYRQLLDAARADRRHRIRHARGVHAAGAARHARAARGDRGLRTASRRRSGVHVEHRRPGLLPHAADRPRWPAGSSRTGTTRRRRRWRSSTTRSRSDSGAARRTRSASGSASATATGGR